MNYARDYANNIDLELAGWRVIRVWECDVKTKIKREETLDRLYKRIISPPETEHYHFPIEDETTIAAEPNTPYGEN